MENINPCRAELGGEKWARKRLQLKQGRRTISFFFRIPKGRVVFYKNQKFKTQTHFTFDFRPRPLKARRSKSNVLFFLLCYFECFEKNAAANIMCSDNQPRNARVCQQRGLKGLPAKNVCSVSRFYIILFKNESYETDTLLR